MLEEIKVRRKFLWFRVAFVTVINFLRELLVWVVLVLQFIGIASSRKCAFAAFFSKQPQNRLVSSPFS